MVSKVLLKRWTVPGPTGKGWLLAKFNPRFPHRGSRLKSPRACAYDEDYVPVDSAATEALWQKTEDKANEVFAALDSDVPFGRPGNADIFRDLVALHYVRSLRYKVVHEESFRRAYARLKENMLGARRELVREEAIRRTGLYLPDGPALALFLDQILDESMPAKGFESGQLFRESIEKTFRQCRDLLNDWEIEISSPDRGSFIIGDCPAITLRRSDADLPGIPIAMNMALGDAHTLVLPLGPKHLLSLGPRQLTGVLAGDRVEWLNRLQIRAAHRHVFFRPDPDTESFVAKACLAILQENP